MGTDLVMSASLVCWTCRWKSVRLCILSYGGLGDFDFILCDKVTSECTGDCEMHGHFSVGRGCFLPRDLLLLLKLAIGM